MYNVTNIISIRTRPSSGPGPAAQLGSPPRCGKIGEGIYTYTYMNTYMNTYIIQ